MKNVMEINGVNAVIAFDPEINMFRGAFVGLNGGADFYSTDIDGLRREGETSLKVFFDMCAKESTWEKVFSLETGGHDAASCPPVSSFFQIPKLFRGRINRK